MRSPAGVDESAAGKHCDSTSCWCVDAPASEGQALAVSRRARVLWTASIPNETGYLVESSLTVLAEYCFYVTDYYTDGTSEQAFLANHGGHVRS